MKGRILAFLCATVLLFGLMGGSVCASGTENHITATTNAQVKPGDFVGTYVYADSLEGLSTLTVSVYFDPAVVKLYNVYNSATCTMYDSAVKEDHIQFTYLFNGSAGVGRVRLFYFYYTPLDDAPVGDSYFDIVVTEACDAQLDPVAISGSRCSFTVAERVVQKTCSMYGTSTVNTAVKEEFTLSYSLSTYQIASGSCVLQYDPELFEVVEVVPGGMLENKLVDSKIDSAGSVYVSFAGTEYATNHAFLTATFRTKKNITTNSNMVMTVTEFCDLDLDPVICSGYTSAVNIAFDPVYTEDSPGLILTADHDVSTGQVTATVRLEADSHLGAGDFTVNFDTEKLTFLSAEGGARPDFFLPNYYEADSGILKFSVVSMTDIVTEETLATFTFDVVPSCTDRTADFTLSARKLADAMTNSILLNVVASPVLLQGAHTLVYHEAQTPTCTEAGWAAYETCERCDYTTYAEMAATGHSWVEATCLAPKTCAVCGLAEGAAAEHRYVDEVCVWCDKTIYTTLTDESVGNTWFVLRQYPDGTHRLMITGDGTMPDWSGTESYGYATSITDIVIGEGVTSLPYGAFSGMTALKTVSLPTTVTTLPKLVFSGCRALTNIDLSCVKFIDNKAFMAAGLTEVALVDNTTLGDAVFYGCDGLVSADLGNVVCYNKGNPKYWVPTQTFTNCSALKNVTFGSKVSVIFTAAFRNTGLESLTVPGTVKNISSNAFVGCKQLKSLVLQDGVQIVGYTAFAACTALEELSLPDSVKSSSTGAFYSCYGLKKVSIGNGLTKTFADMFLDNRALSEVTLPDSLQEIDNRTFFKCGELTAIRMPAKLTAIHKLAFFACYSLPEMHIPASVTAIGDNAFDGCKALKSIYIDSPTVAEGITNNKSMGCLVRNADTVYVKADIANVGAYITDTFTHAGEITLADVTYTVYKR